MAWNIVETKGARGTGGATPVLDTAPSAGDLLILTHASGESDISSYSPPAGFTLLHSLNSSSRAIAMWGKVSDGSEGTNYSVSNDNSTSNASATIIRRITGDFDFDNIVGEVDDASATFEDAISIGPITATADSLLLFDGFREGEAFDGVTGGFSLDGNADGGGRNIDACSKVSAGGSESSTKTISGSVTRQSALLVELLESAPSGPTPAVIAVHEVSDVEAWIDVVSYDPTADAHDLYFASSDLGSDPSDWQTNGTLVAAGIDPDVLYHHTGRSPNTRYHYRLISRFVES